METRLTKHDDLTADKETLRQNSGCVNLKEEAHKAVTRNDLAKAVCRVHCGLGHAQARHLVDLTLEEVTSALSCGEAVHLQSFGHFGIRAKRERIGRNPKTGIEAPIKARRVITFRPSQILIDLLNRSDSLRK